MMQKKKCNIYDQFKKKKNDKGLTKKLSNLKDHKLKKEF